MMCPPTGTPYLDLLKQALEEEGIRVVPVSWFGKQTVYSLSQLFKGKIGGANILHLHWMPFNWFYMMRMVRKISGFIKAEMVWTIHNLIPHEPRYGSTEKDIEAMKYMANWAVAGIAHCEKTKEEFHQIYRKDMPIFVIPHGNFNKYTTPFIKDPEESRKKLNIPPDKIVLLLFPANRWNKGIKMFIDVVKKLPEEYMGILAGKCKNTEIKNYIKRETQKNRDKFIVNLGYLTDEEAGYYFSASDIFFMPYTYITTSGSVMYALGFKKPVISTPKGNLYQLVKNGINGFLCENEEEMIEKILSIDRETARKMGEESYRIASQPQFNWREIAKKTISVYEYITK